MNAWIRGAALTLAAACGPPEAFRRDPPITDTTVEDSGTDDTDDTGSSDSGGTDSGGTDSGGGDSGDTGPSCTPADVAIPGGIARGLIEVPNDAAIDLDLGGLLPAGAVLAFEDAAGAPIAGTFTPGATTYAARLNVLSVSPGTIGFITVDDGCGTTVWSRPFVARVEDALGTTEALQVGVVPASGALEPTDTLLAWAWPDGFGALLRVQVNASPAPLTLVVGGLTTADAPFGPFGSSTAVVARELTAPPSGWNAHDDVSIGLRHPTGEVLPLDVVALADIDGCGIRSSTPPDGDVAVSILRPVEVRFDKAPASLVTATMTALPGGTPVRTTATASGTMLSLRPDTTLAADREHQVSLDTPCGRTVSFRFTTDWAGTLQSPGGEGTYLVGFNRLEVLSPPGVGGLFSSVLNNTDDRIALTLQPDEDTATIWWTSYTTDLGGHLTQDVCADASPTDTLAWSTDRWVASVDPTDPVFPLMSGPAPRLLDADITRFEVVPSEDENRLLAVVLDAIWDARDNVDLYADMLDPADADGLCALLNAFGTSCNPCADAEPYCIDVSFLVYEPQRAETAPSPRSAAAIEADPTCEDALWERAATPWGQGFLDSAGCSSSGPRQPGAPALLLLGLLGLRRRRR